MGKFALQMGAALMLLCLAPVVSAQDVLLPPAPKDAQRAIVSDAERNRVVGYSAWDEDYLYLAVQVNKPELHATHHDPFTDALADDAIIVSLQTDNDSQTTHKTAKTIVVVVSAGGAAQVYVGADSKPLYQGLSDFTAQLEALSQEKDPAVQQERRLALLNSRIKWSVVTKGIPNGQGASASGYSFELAIPWALIGQKAEAGRRLGFNVSAQSIDPAAGSPPLISLSPQVRTNADLANPSLWNHLVTQVSPAPPRDGNFISPQAAVTPLVDGELTPGEWESKSSFLFSNGESGSGANLDRTTVSRIPSKRTLLPAPSMIAASPATTAGSTVPHRAGVYQHATPVVFARYDLGYQGDSRKNLPICGLFNTDGSSDLFRHPLDGVGPWLSSDRADWHRRQLLEMRRTGIDAAVVEGSFATNERGYTLKAVTVLGSVLNELRIAGMETPQIAMQLNLEDLAVDERNAVGLAKLIVNVFRRIPAENRSLLAADGRSAAVVFLTGSAGSLTEAASLEQLRENVQTQLGLDLILVGSEKQTSGGLDGVLPVSGAPGFQQSVDGSIKLITLGAGDVKPRFAEAGKEGQIRRNPQLYRTAWAEVSKMHTDWIFLPGWSDYLTGAALAPTFEDGYAITDLTRIYLHSFTPAKQSARILTHNLPGNMTAGSAFTLRLRLQNTGSTVLGASAAAPYAIAARWLQNGTPVGQPLLLPVTAALLPNQIITAPLSLKAAGENGSAFPAGEYTLELQPVLADHRTALSPATLTVPVHIAAGDGGSVAAELVASDLMSMPENGGAYDVHVTLRNSGSSPWRKAAGARVTFRLFRETEHEVSTPVVIPDATTLLEQDVLPGQEVTVTVHALFCAMDGKSLPIWNADDRWSYGVRWEVAPEGDSSKSAALVDGGPVALTDFDFGARFVMDATPASLPAERRLPVRIKLKNVSSQTWRKDQVRLGCHWYYQDGTELVWEDETSPITVDIAPGTTSPEILAWVNVPPCDGTYWLVWDVRFGDTWASTTGSTRLSDVSVRQVQVIRGRLSFIDLSRWYDTDGTNDGSGSAGNLDGHGDAFPADLMPPFALSPYTPSGMWLADRGGPDSPHRVSFRWGDKEGKAKNLISAHGQTLEFGKSTAVCRVLHIVAASTGKPSTASLRLIFQEPSSRSEDIYPMDLSAWDGDPEYHEPVALQSACAATTAGLKMQKLSLYHYTVRIKEPRPLTAIKLPDLPEMKIAAITLEK